MARIKKKTIQFNHDGVGAVAYRMYYVKDTDQQVDAVPVDADGNPTWPFITIPAVAGQTLYSVVAPDQLPLTDGSWQITVTALDGEGNESDEVAIIRPFDFVAPSAPYNLRVL
jgi:hypothetical protein